MTSTRQYQAQRLLVELGAPVPAGFPIWFNTREQYVEWFRHRSKQDLDNARVYLQGQEHSQGVWEVSRRLKDIQYEVNTI